MPPLAGWLSHVEERLCSCMGQSLQYLAAFSPFSSTQVHAVVQLPVHSVHCTPFLQGFESMRFLHGAIPNFDINGAALWRVYEGNASGAVLPFPHRGCDDERKVADIPMRDPDAKFSVNVYCGEPSAYHQHNLRIAQRELGLTSTLHKGNLAMSWNVVHAAFSDSVGTAEFSANCNTNLCSLRGKGATVNVTTVDAFTYDRAIDYIDVLKVDIRKPLHLHSLHGWCILALGVRIVVQT